LFDKTRAVTHSLTKGHLSSCFDDSTHMCSSLAKTNGFKHYKLKTLTKKHSFSISNQEKHLKHIKDQTLLQPPTKIKP